MSPSCFNDAAVLRRKNEITEDEYLQAIVDLCIVLRHRSHGACNIDIIEPGARGVGLGYQVPYPVQIQTLLASLGAQRSSWPSQFLATVLSRFPAVKYNPQ